MWHSSSHTFFDTFTLHLQQNTLIIPFEQITCLELKSRGRSSRVSTSRNANVGSPSPALLGEAKLLCDTEHVRSDIHIWKRLRRIFAISPPPPQAPQVGAHERHRGRERCAAKSLRVCSRSGRFKPSNRNTGRQLKRENSFPSTRTFFVPGVWQLTRPVPRCVSRTRSPISLLLEKK